VLCRVKEGK